MIYDTVAFIIYAKKTDKNNEIYNIFSRDTFF